MDYRFCTLEDYRGNTKGSTGIGGMEPYRRGEFIREFNAKDAKDAKNAKVF